MKVAVIIVFSFIVFSSWGQDTIYLDATWEKVNSMEQAKYYEVLYRDKNDANQVQKKTYFVSGVIKSDISYSDYEKKVLEGKYISYFENGKVKREIDYVNNLKDGELLTYWKNGNPKRNDQFRKGEFVKGKCFDENGKEIAHFDYHIAAEFPGGINVLLQYVANRVIYPEKLLIDGIEGRVVVKFIVDAKGFVTDVKISSSTNEKFEAEALRVVKSLPNWSPAKVDGKAVKSQYVLPVRFVLSD